MVSTHHGGHKTEGPEDASYAGSAPLTTAVVITFQTWEDGWDEGDHLCPSHGTGTHQLSPGGPLTQDEESAAITAARGKKYSAKKGIRYTKQRGGI